MRRCQAEPRPRTVVSERTAGTATTAQVRLARRVAAVLRPSALTTAVMSLLAGLLVVPAPGGAGMAAAAPGAARLAVAPACSTVGVALASAQGANPIFYVDFSVTPQLSSGYAGWKVANSGATSRSNLWVRLASFTSTGTRTLGVNALEPNAYSLGTLAPGASGVSYTYLTATAISAAPQNYVVQVWTGDPRQASSTQLCEAASSYLRVDSTIQAAANKVSGTHVGPNPPGLSAEVQLTVYGQGTGTIGGGPADDQSVFWMTPAAVSDWQPQAYKLTKSVLYIDPDGSGPLGETTYTDLLRINSFTGGDRPYRIIYTFVTLGVTVASTATYPVQNIASGTQVKHTTLSTYSAFPPIQAAANVTTLALTTPAPIVTPGVVKYTVTVTAGNFGTKSADLNGDGDTTDPGETTTNAGLLDSVRSVLPAATTYVTGSATWKGAAIADPAVSGTTLTFSGPFTLASDTTPTLTFKVSYATSGTYTNSAFAVIGSTQVDTTLVTTDNAPAVATVEVRWSSTVALRTSASSTRFGVPVTLTATVSPNAPTGTVTFTDTPPAGTAVVLGSAPVSADIATLTVAMPAFGANSVVATYGGDSTHSTATSTAVSVEAVAYAGEVIVTELRMSGPGGANDEYVELYNTGPAAPMAGFVVTTDSGATATLPANAGSLATGRSYLVAGAAFSLGGVATPDATVPSLGTGGAKVLAPDTAATSTDSVGPATGYHLGTALPAMAGTPTAQHAWVRVEVAGAPVDTRDNAADFALVSTTGGVVGGVQSMLGSPSPTGVANPYQHNAVLQSVLLDTTKVSSVAPNRVYVAGAPGSLVIRRTITNSSAGTVTAAKVRITALSEANGEPLAGGNPSTVALLRAVNPATPTSQVVTGDGGTVTVQNLSVDAPIAGLPGGGLNSTFTVPFPGGTLAPGASVDVAFTFAVDTGGTFWFGYDVDAVTTVDGGLSQLSGVDLRLPESVDGAHRRDTAGASGRL